MDELWRFVGCVAHLVVASIVQMAALVTAPVWFLIARYRACTQTPVPKSRTALITGAGAGIGQALAVKLAKKFDRLVLVDLSAETLNETKSLAERNGCKQVCVRTANVTDSKKMARLIADEDQVLPIDLAIANAGVAAHTVPNGTGKPVASVEEGSRGVLEVNVLGTLATLLPLASHMRSRGEGGHLVFVGSLASYFPAAISPDYSSSKAAVRAFGEGLRELLAPEGIRVSVVNPGFVRTPMTDAAKKHGVHALPFMVGVDEAASKILAAIDDNVSVAAFPCFLEWVLSALGSLPAPLKGLVIAAAADRKSRSMRL